MKRLSCIAACLFSISCFGQTKLISFRSHSGSDAHFHTAVEHNLFDIGNSNFGIVGQYVRKIDTVMLKPDDKIIVLGRSYFTYNRKTDTSRIKDTLTRTNAMAVSAGLFNANNMAELKAAINKIYRPDMVNDSPRFIGFTKKFWRKETPLKK